MDFLKKVEKMENTLTGINTINYSSSKLKKFTTICVSRGNFKSFIESINSYDFETLQKITITCFENLCKDLNWKLPNDLDIYSENTLIDFEKYKNFYNESIANKTLITNLTSDQILEELDKLVKDYIKNDTSNFRQGQIFLDMKKDKVDLLVSCGDGYLARFPMERLKIKDYLNLRYTEEVD